MKGVAAVELGGTRAAVTAGSSPRECAAPLVIDTTSPDETLERVCGALRGLRDEGWRFDRIGVASFGPIGVDPLAPDYGRMQATPKPGWTGAEVRASISAALDAPVVLDTDVNAAAVGEGRWGASQRLRTHAYVTVGTGVGVGVVANGAPLHGLTHPEGGHLQVRRDPLQDPYVGRCPWHGDCLEGLVSGPALRERLGAPGETAPADDPVWELVGGYLGQAFAALTLLVSPQRIVLGGGVGRRPQVRRAATAQMLATLGGYIGPLTAEAATAYVVAPTLDAWSGLFGAMALALDATETAPELQSIAPGA